MSSLFPPDPGTIQCGSAALLANVRAFVFLTSDLLHLSGSRLQCMPTHKKYHHQTADGRKRRCACMPTHKKCSFVRAALNAGLYAVHGPHLFWHAVLRFLHWSTHTCMVWTVSVSRTPD